MKNLKKILERAFPILLLAASCTCLGIHLGLSFGPARVEKITITDSGDGWVVNGDLHIPQTKPGPYPAVILSHGSGGDRSQMAYVAAAIAEKGIMVLNIDLSGYGESPNQWSYENHQNDMRASYYYLCNRSDVDGTRVGAAGFSLGGRTSIDSVFTVPIKTIVSIGYTWLYYGLNASYPANILFVTGTSDTLMAAYTIQVMQIVSGISNPQENVLYGDISSYTARQFTNVQSDHGGTPMNIEAIDTTAAWFDRCLNGNANPSDSSTLARFITQIAAIIGFCFIAIIAAFLIGKRLEKQRHETIPLASVEESHKLEPGSKPRPFKAGVKGTTFIITYLGCWIPALILFNSTGGTGAHFSDALMVTFPFITGLHTTGVMTILLVSCIQLVMLGILVRFIFKRIDVKNADCPSEMVLPLKETPRDMVSHLLGGFIILGILCTSLVLSVQFTLYKIAPATQDQWLTFLVLLPLSFAFVLGDQLWFGAIVQRHSAFQKNRKMFIAFFVALLLKLSVAGAFIAVNGLDYSLPVLIVLVFSLPFNFWLTQFFKSIYPGTIMTSVLLAIVVPMLSIV